MGEWRVQVSVRVSQDLRRELESFAARERRTLGNLGGILIEWSFEQLKAAGGTDKLLRFKIPQKGK